MKKKFHQVVTGLIVLSKAKLPKVVAIQFFLMEEKEDEEADAKKEELMTVL